MLIPSDEVNILNYFRVMIILILLLLLTNLHLKLLSTQGTGTDYANVQINPPSLVETSTLPGQPFPPIKDLHITEHSGYVLYLNNHCLLVT